MNRTLQTLAGRHSRSCSTTASCAAELKYSITPDFFEANPGGKPIGPCHGGTVIDKAGNIYITTDTDRGILVFSPEGKFLRNFGPTRIHGLEMRTENGVEYIYGARPADHEVLKLKLDGTIEWTIHYPPEAGIYKNQDGFKFCAVIVLTGWLDLCGRRLRLQLHPEI